MANVQIGDIKPAAYATAGANWLLADGAAIDRTAYADLFAIIGTTYGVGNGSTTFNVPDLQGRVPLGDGSGSGLTARTLGETGGSEKYNYRLSTDDAARETPISGDVPAVSIFGEGVGATRVRSFGDDANTVGGGSDDNMQPFVVVQYVICYQVDQPTGNYRYLEELTAETSIADTDIIYGVKTPTTTPLSRKYTWTSIKAFLLTWINGLFVSLKQVDLGTNGTSLDCDSAFKVSAYGVYTASTTLTFSNATTTQEIKLGITNTNANVLTISGITVYFKDSQLPDGVSFASNALTFPADSAIKYNITLIRFHADAQFDGFIELRTEV